MSETTRYAQNLKGGLEQTFLSINCFYYVASLPRIFGA